MRFMPVLAVAALLLSLTGCCCGPEPQRSELQRLAAREATYVALRLTSLGPSDDGGEQVLIESLVVSAPQGADMPATFAASGDAMASPILSRVPGAAVLQKPSVVTRVTETATIEVGHEEGDDVSLDTLSITVHPGDAGGSRTIELTYRRTSNGEPVHWIEKRTVEVPAGKVLVLEAERP